MTANVADTRFRFSVRRLFGVLTLAALLSAFPAATLAIGVSLVFFYDATSCLLSAVIYRNSGSVFRLAFGVVHLLVAAAAVWVAAVIIAVTYAQGDPLKWAFAELVGFDWG